MAVDNVSLIDAIANDKENACLVLLSTMKYTPMLILRWL